MRDPREAVPVGGEVLAEPVEHDVGEAHLRDLVDEALQDVAFRLRRRAADAAAVELQVDAARGLRAGRSALAELALHELLGRVDHAGGVHRGSPPLSASNIALHTARRLWASPHQGSESHAKGSQA